jgi:hypothetical protein
MQSDTRRVGEEFRCDDLFISAPTISSCEDPKFKGESIDRFPHWPALPLT